MKTPRAAAESTPQPDLELAGGCFACGGVLSVRVSPGTSHAVCRACGWWSSPRLVRHPDGLHVRLPTPAQA